MDNHIKAECRRNSNEQSNCADNKNVAEVVNLNSCRGSTEMHANVKYEISKPRDLKMGYELPTNYIKVETLMSEELAVKHEVASSVSLENNVESTGLEKYTESSNIKLHRNGRPEGLASLKLEAKLEGANMDSAQEPFISEELDIKDETNVTQDKLLECPLCKNRFTEKELLLQHLLFHQGLQPFECKICSHKTSCKWSLKEHMKVHSEEKPFVCESCEYKTFQEKNLHQHMKIHTGEKPFACEVCEYKTTQKGTLNRHMGIHTGGRAYVCEVCGYKTSYKKNLNVHMKLHAEEKPFVCELCEYKTTRKCNLNLHMRTHTGDKPFACEFCEYKTTQKGTLTRHKRIHTEQNPLVCELNTKVVKREFILRKTTHQNGELK